jgi:hypothetical protein
VIEHFGGNPVVLGAHQAVSVRFVAQDKLYFGVELLRLDDVDDRLQISPAAGNQYTDRNLPRHIS